MKLNAFAIIDLCLNLKACRQKLGSSTLTTRGLLSLLGISRGLRCFDLTNVDRVCYFLPRDRIAQSEVEVNFVTVGQKAWS